jgi:hypothetical protein
MAIPHNNCAASTGLCRKHYSPNAYNYYTIYHTHGWITSMGKL